MGFVEYDGTRLRDYCVDSIQKQPRRRCVYKLSNRNLTLMSAGEGAVIDLEGRYPFVRGQNINLEIHSLRLERGLIDNLGGPALGFGGTLNLEGSATRLVDSTFVDSFAMYDGGAIYLTGGTIGLENVRIVLCTTDRSGGALCLQAGAVATLEIGTVISDCHSTGKGFGQFGGGAIAAQNRLVRMLPGSSILRCTASDSGGGFGLLFGSSASLTSAQIRNCTSPLGGGVRSQFSSTVHLTSTSLIAECHATSKGGAASIQDAEFHITASSSIVNCSTAVSGGAASLDGGTFLAEGSLILSCQAEANGGCLSATSGSVSLLQSRIEHCTSPSHGSVLFCAGGEVLIMLTIVTIRALTLLPSTLVGRQRGCNELIHAARVDSRTMQLVIRSTVIIPEANCTSPMANTRSKTCGDSSYHDPLAQTSFGVCADLASCSDSAMEISQNLLSNIECTCQPPAYSYHSFDPMLAAYEADGCVTPKRMESVSLIYERISTTIIKQQNSFEAFNLTLQMTGTDRAATTWVVTNADTLPPWVVLPVHATEIPAGASTLQIPVALSAVGLPELSAAYTTTLLVTVASAQLSLHKEVPISLLVTSRTFSIVWGNVGSTSTCDGATVAEVSTEVKKSNQGVVHRVRRRRSSRHARAANRERSP
eukprot:308380-Prymnesium_polylepis.1